MVVVGLDEDGSECGSTWDIIVWAIPANSSDESGPWISFKQTSDNKSVGFVVMVDVEATGLLLLLLSPAGLVLLVDCSSDAEGGVDSLSFFAGGTNVWEWDCKLGEFAVGRLRFCSNKRI